MVKQIGTAYPNATGYTFGCAGGGSLLPGESPWSAKGPWLIVEVESGVAGIVIDSVVKTAEHPLGVRREVSKGIGRISTGGYFYSSFGVVSANLPASLPLSQAGLTIAAVVYHHRDTREFVSPKVSYRCEP